MQNRSAELVLAAQSSTIGPLDSQEKIMEDALCIFARLGEKRHMPVEAIRDARDSRPAMVPLFLKSFEEFSSSNGEASHSGALFFAFHLLGEWREKAAYRPLATFLRLPEEVLEEALGDATASTAHRVMAAVFDGDPAPIYEIVRDPNADQFVRSGMFDTITMLTLVGDLPRTDTAEFLRACYFELEPQQDNFVWHGWVDAVASLGLADLKPLVAEAFARGSLDEDWLIFEDFEDDLRHAVAHPEAGLLSAGADLRSFDTLDELADWAWFEPEEQSDSWDDWGPSYYSEPAIPCATSAVTIRVHAAAARSSRHAV